MISFTGGTETGRAIAHAAAARLAPTVLELGGKSPNIVFDDADVERAAAGAVEAIFGSGGQSCVAGSRLFVHGSIFDGLLARVVQKAEALHLGPPQSPQTEMGPLATFGHRDRIEARVRAAVAAGARIETGGRRPEGSAFAKGAYYLPTVLSGVQNEAAICQEELFGPVLCVLPFTDEADLVRQANDTIYGLACGIWTEDYRRVWRLARAVNAGTVWVNSYKQLSIAAPFGGFKESGVGREKGLQGLRIYQQPKSIYWSLD
jgi:acyl-CoA reductase-like NAD-dependent aldehyde dehydrogenase